MHMKKLCIFGTGGFGRETLCAHVDAGAAKGFDTSLNTVFMIDDAYYQAESINGIPVIKRSDFDPALYNVVVAIGDPHKRMSVVQKMPEETTYGTVIHPSAVISSWVDIGAGSIITAGCIVTCQITLGKHTHLNLQTTIGHDCDLGDFLTTAPSVNINGSNEIGSRVYFGTGAGTKEGVRICDDVVIGMGAMVTKNIELPGVYIGCPAKRMEK